MTALVLDVRELSFDEVDGVSGGDEVSGVVIPVIVPNPPPMPWSQEWLDQVICGGPNGPL